MTRLTSMQKYWLEKYLHRLIELSAPLILVVGVGIVINMVTSRLDKLIQITGPGQ